MASRLSSVGELVVEPLKLIVKSFDSNHNYKERKKKELKNKKN